MDWASVLVAYKTTQNRMHLYLEVSTLNRNTQCVGLKRKSERVQASNTLEAFVLAVGDVGIDLRIFYFYIFVNLRRLIKDKCTSGL